MWITINWKILKEKEYQTILPVSSETCMWVKKQQLELDMEQLIGSKLGKEYGKAVCCHTAYFSLQTRYIMQNAGMDKSQAGIKIAGRNINNLRYTDDIS